MLTELIGRGHVAGPTLASLGTNFGLSPLIGKPLAMHLRRAPSVTESDAEALVAQPVHITVNRDIRSGPRDG